MGGQLRTEGEERALYHVARARSERSGAGARAHCLVTGAVCRHAQIIRDLIEVGMTLAKTKAIEKVKDKVSAKVCALSRAAGHGPVVGGREQTATSL